MALEITRRRICPNLVLCRSPVGAACCWVSLANGDTQPTPRRVRHHSPDGIEWGYGGSGPADFALSICSWIFPVGCDGLQTVKLWRGRCSQIAWTIHQDLKRKFISPLPCVGGELSGAAIDEWLDEWLEVLARQEAAGERPELTRGEYD